MYSPSRTCACVNPRSEEHVVWSRLLPQLQELLLVEPIVMYDLVVRGTSAATRKLKLE